jgi:hypothetical protein
VGPVLVNIKNKNSKGRNNITGFGIVVGAHNYYYNTELEAKAKGVCPL